MVERTKKLPSWERKKRKRLEEAGAPSGKAAKAPSEESRLNEACKAAKAASEDARQRYRDHKPPQPGDEEVQRAYSAAKQAMREFQATKPPSTKPPKVKKPAKEKKRKQKAEPLSAEQQQAADEASAKRQARRQAAADDVSTESTPWTCAVCGITINVRADGRAREQHLAGKKHALMVEQQQAGEKAA